jgi:DGQHR domain-containing protein
MLEGEEPMKRTINALPFHQGDHTFYLALMTKEDFPKQTITDQYAFLKNITGYQRGLDESRAADYGLYIEDNPSPRVILLNVRRPAKLKFANGKLVIPEVLYIVDGQHLEEAIQVRKADTVFQTPVIICNVDQNEEALLFSILNDLGVRPKTDHRQQIVANPGVNLDRLPPSRIKKAKRERIATQVTNELFSDVNSIWAGKITVTGQRHNKKVNLIRQATFVSSLERDLVKRNSVTVAEAKNAVNAMWEGARLVWEPCFTVPGAYVLLGMMGVNVLHKLLGEYIYPRLQRTPFAFDKKVYQNIFEATGITTEDWVKGDGRIGKHLGTNRAVYHYVVKMFTSALDKKWPKHLPKLVKPAPKKRGRPKMTEEQKIVKQRPSYTDVKLPVKMKAKAKAAGTKRRAIN